MTRVSPRFTPEALERLGRVPFFIRPFVKARLEREAKSRGVAEITPALIDELKSREHKGARS